MDVSPRVDRPVVIRARPAPQVVVLAFTTAFVAGGLAKWLNGDPFVGLPEYFGSVLALGGLGFAWFRAFRVELTTEGIAFRNLWGCRAWAWDEISSGYVAHGVAPGAFGGLRPVFRVTLHHRDGNRMDIPYNVCGLQALAPLLHRLEQDGKRNKDGSEWEA